MCKSQCGGYCNNLHSQGNVEVCFNSAATRNLLETELKKWEVLLTSVKQENGFLILKLSFLVDDNSGKEFLSRAEYFQNEFITTHENLQELEKDINEQLQIIIVGNQMPGFSKKQNKLRNELYSFERNYVSLKNEFADYLINDK